VRFIKTHHPRPATCHKTGDAGAHRLYAPLAIPIAVALAARHSWVRPTTYRPGGHSRFGQLVQARLRRAEMAAVGMTRGSIFQLLVQGPFQRVVGRAERIAGKAGLSVGTIVLDFQQGTVCPPVDPWMGI